MIPHIHQPVDTKACPFRINISLIVGIQNLLSKQRSRRPIKKSTQTSAQYPFRLRTKVNLCLSGDFLVHCDPRNPTSARAANFLLKKKRHTYVLYTWLLNFSTMEYLAHDFRPDRFF